jgi:hypothetical protein
MTRNNYSIGIALIAVAIVLLLGKLGVFAFLGRVFWPLLLLALGGVLHALYFLRMAPPVALVPGGMLIAYSLLFLFCNVFGWGYMAYLWPGFIFGVAVGLYELYLFDRHSPRGLYTAAIILAVVSAVFFGLTLLFRMNVYLIIILLLAAGCVLLLRRPRTW